jgi:hypothetical protein
MKQACQRETRNFAMILMLAAVAGAIAGVARTGIEIGRAAGWWP